MATPTSKITLEIETRILELCSDHNNSEISRMIKDEFNVAIDRSTVSKFLSTRKPDREISKYTRTIVQDYIGATIITDLDILERVRDDLYAYFRNINEDNLSFNQRLQCVDRLNKVIDIRLKYAGAEQPVNNTTNVIMNKYNNVPDEDLKAELERLENME